MRSQAIITAEKTIEDVFGLVNYPVSVVAAGLYTDNGVYKEYEFFPLQVIGDDTTFKVAAVVNDGEIEIHIGESRDFDTNEYIVVNTVARAAHIINMRLRNDVKIHLDAIVESKFTFIK